MTVDHPENLDRLGLFKNRLPQHSTAGTEAIKLRFRNARAAATPPNSTAIPQAQKADLTPPSIETAIDDKASQSAVDMDMPVSNEASPEPSSISNENGFQIFKNKPVQSSAKPAQLTPQNDIPKDAEPVPMEADAIEEALRLINAEDEELAQSDNPDHIGFAPIGIADAEPEIKPEIKDADEALIDAIITPGVFGADTPPTPTEQDNHDDHDAHAEAAPSEPISEKASIPPADKLHHWQIGQSIAHTIKGIVKSEVDHALDQLARQAVRDALKAQRA